MQILHTGRYSYQEGCVAPSPITAPINFYRPKELDHEEILQTIDDYARCAKLAQMAGYDGVEVMGSEGYLINEFIVKKPITGPMNGVDLMKTEFVYQSALSKKSGRQQVPIF